MECFNIILLFILSYLHAVCCTPLFKESLKIVDRNGKDRDHFGSWNSIAVTDTHMAVGAWQDDERHVSNIGSISVYTISPSKGIDPTGTKIVPFDGKQNDYFGFSVAMNKEFIVVGAEGNQNVGAVYIYRTDKNNTFHSKLFLSTAKCDAGEKFGSSVAISSDDNTLVVGNYGQNSGEGAVYVYRLQNESWSLVHVLRPSDLRPSDWFGWGLSVSRDTIAVAAHGKEQRSGCVYLYMKDNNNTTKWTLKQKLSPPVKTKNSYFGYSLKLDGNKLVAGALGVEKTYVYGLVDDGSWSLKETLSASDSRQGYYFGSTVTIQEDKIAIAARNFGFGDIRSVGVVYVFKYNETSQRWQESVKLKPSDGAKADFFGVSIAICRKTVYCTSSNNAKGHARGAVYVFQDGS